MYELFYYPGNASMAPHFMLEEVGAPFVLRLVDRKTNGQKDPKYMQRNPMGRIPTLIDGDLVLFESAAICLHLADRHPETGLAPALGTHERAQLYKWLMFLTNTIQPDLMTWFYPETYTIDAGGTEAVKAAAEARLEVGHRVIAEALERGGPYLLGDTVSVADLFLLMVVGWGRFLRNPPINFPAIRRCTERVAERPTVRRALQTEDDGRE